MNYQTIDILSAMNSLNYRTHYDIITDHYPNHPVRPVIGITGNFGDKGLELAEGYYRSVEQAGGIPIAIPATENKASILGLLDRIDGLLLSGGGDINPLCLDEEPIAQLRTVNPQRDVSELLITRLAYDRQIPILGICRGTQVLTAALGGKIHQDLQACLPDTEILKHSQDMPRHAVSHSVTADAGSLVASLLGEKFYVNSFHHQAVSEAGPELRITARAADGVAEAVESTALKSVLGVQWHPECFIQGNNQSMRPLFTWLVGEAESYRAARAVHRDILTIDSHCDTPMLFAEGVQLDRRNPHSCMDLHKMAEGGLDAVVMAAYLPQGGRSSDELKAATERAFSLITDIKDRVYGCYGVSLSQTPKQLYQAKNVGKKSVMLGVENGYAIGRDIANIEKLQQEGVVYMTLCHNGDNDLCDSAVRSNNEHGGLSDLGRLAVAEMNRVGMLIDLSHAAESTFYDVLQESSRPVCCSHSSARALCDHPRNLTDDQLRALAETGGVAQVTFYSGFLREGSGEASIDDAVRHLLHMIDVAGIDHVGIGTDFDGDGGVVGLRTASELINFTRRLMAEGLGTKHLRKLWGGNFVRVLSKAQYGCDFRMSENRFSTPLQL